MKSLLLVRALCGALFSLPKTRCKDTFKRGGFSLVEMLMALLVASLLLAALAPVMTRRMGENVTVNSDVNFGNNETEIRELTYGMNDEENHIQCVEPDDEPGADYCEGTFVVPDNVYQLKVIAIGAGGGGGTAPTAGFVEYTDPDASNNFTVPAMVNKIEATLVSGGAGGGAGGQVTKTQTFVTSGNGGITNKTENDTITVNSDGTGTWNIPAVIKNRNILASACGGGGGGGSTAGYFDTNGNDAHGGGSGGYVLDKVLNFGTSDSFTYYIGGGGAGSANPGGESIHGPVLEINKAKNYGGGGAGTGLNKKDLNLSIAATGGGNGLEATFGCNNHTTQVGSGVLKTASTSGGAGGKGVPYGVTIGKDTIYECTPYIYAGDGGQPGGGGGGVVQFANCYNGGGGGGGAASQIVIGTGIFLNAPGGGGGAGAFRAKDSWWCAAGYIAPGGGGGGTGGGAGGGSANDGIGRGGTGGSDASGYNGGLISTIFGDNYCNGGRGGIFGASDNVGYAGQSGAIRLTYLDYGPGGSGGGAGQLVPIQSVNNLSPGDTLTIKIGQGANGGTAGKIESNGTSTNAGFGYGIDTIGEPIVSSIAKAGTVLLTTTYEKAYVATGLRGGSPTGEVFGCTIAPFYGCLGHITDGKYGDINFVIPNGFSNTNGYNAGNSEGTGNPLFGSHTYNNGTSGGAGGKLITPFTPPCVGNTGGTENTGDHEGKTATQGYGCGGGGGYGLADGGDGSGGYARISWNMYWNIALNSGDGDYEIAAAGVGGGGASGNTMISGLDVIPGSTIRFRIGKGGAGAFVSENSVQEAKNGGTTIFGCSGTGNNCSGGIRAGGGGRGGNPVANFGQDVQNGTGGITSNECSAGGRDYLHNTNICTIGSAVNASNNTNGSRGANYTTPSALSKYSNRIGTEAISGTGGEGGQRDTGDNANGKAGGGIAAGGGGAAIRYNKTNATTNETNNTTRGGNGANGKIILEWIKM